MDFVIIRIGVALHAEELWARFPDGHGNVVERERLGDRAGDAQQRQPVAAGAEPLEGRTPRGLFVLVLQDVFSALPWRRGVPKGPLGHDGPSRGSPPWLICS